MELKILENWLSNIEKGGKKYAKAEEKIKGYHNYIERYEKFEKKY